MVGCRGALRGFVNLRRNGLQLCDGRLGGGFRGREGVLGGGELREQIRRLIDLRLSNGDPLPMLGAGALEGEVELGSEEEKKQAEEQRGEQEESFKDLIACLRNAVQDEVKEVRLSRRLTSSPACLVLEEGDVTPQIQAMLRQAGQEVPVVKPILELNAGHPLLPRLKQIFEADGTDARLPEYAALLYGQALLAEGGELPDPAAFSRRLADLMLKAL